MDTNSWRPASGGGGEPTMDGEDWRSQLQPDSRQRIVNKIMDTLKRHLPLSGHEGLQELNKIAVRFEEKIYTSATSQSDYLRKISMKMLTMETKSQNSSQPSNSGTNSNPPPDTGSLGMQAQIANQGQSPPIPMAANQSQARQQLLSQNIQNNMAATAVQSSATLTSALPTIGGLPPTTMTNVVGQNSNLQNISGISQSSVGNSIGQGVSSNTFSTMQRQMPSRQQVVPQQQQSQHPQNQYLYQQQQFQQQLMKQKYQQGGIPNTQMQSHLQQQQQQQNQILSQSTQLQSSPHSVMQHSVMQPAPVSGLQQNQQSSVQHSNQPMLQKNAQAILRQQQQQQPSIIQQQQAPMQQLQQPMLPSQQQQQLMGQQPNSTIGQQNQIVGQQNNIPDIQQQQRLASQQNNLSNLQQQQVIGQQNNLPNMHQHQHQQLGGQSNMGALQQRQQQLLVNQSGNSTMQTSQHSVHMLPQSKYPLQQQNHQSVATLLPTQAQQSEPQPPQQPLLSQIQSQPGQLQQQGLQQPNSLQRDMQPRLQPSGPLLQSHNMIDQQKQLFQSQRAISEASASSLDSIAQPGIANTGDWQEEVYQKIKVMKEAYFSELSETYQKVTGKLQQHESLPQHQNNNEQFEKLKVFKTMLERILQFLQVPKSNILPHFKEKMVAYEKQIITFINSNRPRKPSAAASAAASLQQSQSQITQAHPIHENSNNPQLQSMNLQASSLSGVPSTSQSMVNSLQPSCTIDSGQGNSLNALQQAALSSLPQNPVNAPQQANISSLSRSGMNVLQPNLTLQSNSNMLQNQHLKQQEHSLLQAQLKQQLQQRHMQQQFIQKQHLLQQQQHLHQQNKQQQNAQMQPHKMPQLHQMNDTNDFNMRQQMGVKTGIFQQHHSSGQSSVYQHQQFKPGAQFTTSSPQLLQTASPQITQQPSPQMDQKNQRPLQSTSSPFVVPSPSSPIAPSLMLIECEKVKSGVSALSNVETIGHQQTACAATPAQSLAIGTPGISASPLLAEFTNPDGNHGNASAAISGKSIVTEQPLERLLKVVKSMSPTTLSASVSDIDSVVSMMDRIAGSAPGNGSRTAVGEDLVAMTKCRLQARNISTQEINIETKKMRRYTIAMPLNVVSSAGSTNDSFKHLTCSEASDLDSTATSSIKRPRIEAKHTLLEEIREINHRLIDTVVCVSDEDDDPNSAAGITAESGEGTVVKCSFSAVAMSPNLKSQYASAQMSPIQPLLLLVPISYPYSSPILLDKFPIEISKECEDLSLKAKSRFNISLRNLSQPMSLGEMAKTWDACARAVILEYAQLSNGGSFSSNYGTWENFLSAA